MKPTEKQKEAAQIVAGSLQAWAASNDIDSPTHGSDLMSDLMRAGLSYDDVMPFWYVFQKMIKQIKEL